MGDICSKSIIPRPGNSHCKPKHFKQLRLFIIPELSPYLECSQMVENFSEDQDLSESGSENIPQLVLN